MSDAIFVRDARFQCRLGTTSEERAVPQEVRVDVELGVGTSKAGATDRIADTVDYVEVWKGIEEAVVRQEHHLVEALAARVAQTLLDGFPRVDDVRVRVTKPAALASLGAASAGVEVRRSRRNG